eukprot:g5740.t1
MAFNPFKHFRRAKSSVSDVFRSLEYSAAPESDTAARAWFNSNDSRFGLFINNQFIHPEGREYAPSFSPATGEKLAETLQGTAADVDMAVSAARQAQKKWSALPAHARSRHMYAIARHLQKHHKLLAVVESLDNGKTLRETRDVDVPLAIRHFYSHAGWAQVMPREMPDQEPLGVIGQIIPWNFPLLMLAWKIAPALATGNTVVLKPAPSTRLSAWLFAEICVEAGLPRGVVNIVSGDNEMATHLASHPDLDKLAFTGSTSVGKYLREITAGTGRKLSLELGGKSPVVVYDSADLDSAVEGLVNGVWFNQGQVCCAGSRLLVQENVADIFLEKLKTRMDTLRIGASLDKCVDMGPLVSEDQKARVQSFIDIGKEEGCDIYQSEYPKELDVEGSFFPPTLVTNVQPTSPLVQEEIFGPVLVAQSFRTPEEAIALANNTKYGLSAGVWTESIGLALESAMSMKAGVVWVNCHNMFDAAAGFGGCKESGYGREGGKEGLYLYTRPALHKDSSHYKSKVPNEWIENEKEWGKAINKSPMDFKKRTQTDSKEYGMESILPCIDRTPKMYIGGKQKRPDNSYVRPVIDPRTERLIGQVGEGSRKDIRDAVEAAHAAKKDWGKRAAHNRAQILYYIAENLSARRDEFGDRISSMTGQSESKGVEEVDAAIHRLFTYGAYADKFGGNVQETQLYGLTVSINEPVGVVGIVCPEKQPLLSFVSLIAPAVVRGNTVVAVPSEAHPLAATDLYQVFDTSDLPGGVVNIVTGQKDHLAKSLVTHQHVDAVWYYGTAEGSYHVEKLSAGNMKRTRVNYGVDIDWEKEKEAAGDDFLRDACEVKTVWVPMGE